MGTKFAIVLLYVGLCVASGPSEGPRLGSGRLHRRPNPTFALPEGSHFEVQIEDFRDLGHL